MSRRQFLLQEGEICRHKTFVAKGLLKAYRRKDDGTEYIMKFAPENSWMVDAESYNRQTPSKDNIEALEDSELIIWTRESMRELFTSVPAFRFFSEKLMEVNIYASHERILKNISYTSEEKYQDFITSFPDV